MSARISVIWKERVGLCVPILAFLFVLTTDGRASLYLAAQCSTENERYYDNESNYCYAQAYGARAGMLQFDPFRGIDGTALFPLCNGGAPGPEGELLATPAYEMPLSGRDNLLEDAHRLGMARLGSFQDMNAAVVFDLWIYDLHIPLSHVKTLEDFGFSLLPVPCEALFLAYSLSYRKAPDLVEEDELTMIGDHIPLPPSILLLGAGLIVLGMGRKILHMFRRKTIQRAHKDRQYIHKDKGV